MAAGGVAGRPAADVAQLRPGAWPRLPGKGPREAGGQAPQTGAALAGVHPPRVRPPQPEAVPAPCGEHPRRVVRELPSAPSSVRVYQDNLGHWYASFVVSRQAGAAPEVSGAIGIDWGVSTVATTTDPAYDLPYEGYRKNCAVGLAKASGAWRGGGVRGGRPSRPGTGVPRGKLPGSRRRPPGRTLTRRGCGPVGSLTTTRPSRLRTSGPSSWPSPPWRAKPPTRRSVQPSGNLLSVAGGRAGRWCWFRPPAPR